MPLIHQPLALAAVCSAGPAFVDTSFGISEACDGVTRVPSDGSCDDLSERTRIHPLADVPPWPVG